MKKTVLLIASFITVLLTTETALCAEDHNGGTMSGTFKLTDNTYLLNPITVSGTLTIDLNGFVLTPKNGAAHVIEIPGGATLIIKDSNPTLGHEGYIDDNGLFRWPYDSASGKPIVIVKGGIICNLYYNSTTNRKGLSVNGTCTMQGGKIMGCFTPGIGSAVTISSGGSFSMTNGEISYNYSKKDAGGNSGVIYGEPSHSNNGSRINLRNTTVSHNKTEGRGGAICAYHVVIDNCDISYNQSSTHGGAIWVRRSSDSKTDGTLNIANSTILHNTSNDLGGAIYIDDDTPCVINNSTISHNAATSSGGAINTTGSLTITGSTLSYNSGVNGGGIRVNGTCVIDDSVLEYNYATTSGGGIYSSGPTTITDSFIRNNWAMSTETGTPKVNRGRGGGFLFAGNSTKDESNAIEFILDNTLISGNASMYYGGGGQLQSSGKLTIRNNTKINDNICVLDGAAGLHLTGGVFFYMQERTEISGNIAYGGVGGGIHSSYECFIHLNGGKISNNIVYGRGGGVHVNTGGDLVLNGTDITGNKAYDGYDMVTSTVTKGTDGKYSWSTPQGNPDKPQPGYGGGLLVNSGSCTMNKGNLSENYAQTLGGGIGLIMQESSAEYAKYVRLTVFTLNSGNVSNNSTDGNGGGIYLMENILNNLSASEKSVYTQLVNGGDWTPKIILNGGNFSGNSAGNNGGGAYQEQDTEFLISSGMNTVISNNKAEKSGGAVFIAKGKFTVNGSVNITANRAIQGDGGAIYIGLGTQAKPSELIVGNNANLQLGGSSSNEGNTAGANGGGIYCEGKFTANGESIIQHNRALSGGGIYVSNGTVKFAASTISNNKAIDGNGGAVYLNGGGLSASGNVIMSSNQASKNGGSVYIKEGGISVTGNNSMITLSDNHATNGGAFYIDGGDIVANTISKATITNNYSTAEGGAFYVTGGNINLCDTELSGNGKSGTEVKTTNGGAIALYNGVFSFGDNSEIKNNAATNFGGALYVANADQTSISCSGGSYINNTAGLGGGIYASGPIALTFAANVRDNIAKNGGGLYLDGGVNMSFGNGLIVGNRAEVEQSAARDASQYGAGGGIYLNNGTLSFTEAQNLGIYNNAASYEAADIYASGNGTTINLPNVSKMNLTGFDVPGSELYWVNDYNGNRYEAALKDLKAEIEKMILGFDDAETVKTIENEKTCLDLGYDLVFVKINSKNLDAYDNAAIKISYKKKGTNDIIIYRKMLFLGEETQIVSLPSGDWNFETADWSFKYDKNKLTFVPLGTGDEVQEPTDNFYNITRKHNFEFNLTFAKKQDSGIPYIRVYEFKKVNKLIPGGSNNN